MKLSDFTVNLFEQGKVTVAGSLMQFEKSDLQQTGLILRDFYRLEILKLPGTPPDFYPAAAVWGAKYIYYAIQFSLLRDLGPELLPTYFPEFPRKITPEAIFSVDLTFRYLPDLIKLASGLAPDDPLVTIMRKTAVEWPFSTVGMQLEDQPDLTVILAHPSLKGEYVDRVIEKRDTHRSVEPALQEEIKAALGAHAQTLWPAFNEINSISNEN